MKMILMIIANSLLWYWLLELWERRDESTLFKIIPIGVFILSLFINVLVLG